jgi:hypothetical protein
MDLDERKTKSSDQNGWKKETCLKTLTGIKYTKKDTIKAPAQTESSKSFSAYYKNQTRTKVQYTVNAFKTFEATYEQKKKGFQIIRKATWQLLILPKT